MGKGKDKFVTIVVGLISSIIVGALYYFNPNARSYNQYIVGNLIGIFWVPMLSILFLFNEEPSKFGFSLGSWKRIWVVLVIAFAGMFVFIMLQVSHWEGYQNYYPLFKWYPEFMQAFANYPATNPFTSASTWMLMLYAEISYGMYLFCWEFFFRGYMLFGLRSIGWWAVLVQAIFFMILHIGKPVTEVIGSFGAGVILGIIALNAKSFVPGFVLHWLISITLDVFVVMTKTQAG